ncbi:MAG: hypothetical protein V4636_05440 [Pseudomonadota bacterium]
MSEFPVYKDFVRGVVLAKIAELLGQCTEGQRDFYGRMYPSGPTYEQMATAYDQVCRTVIKNIAKAEGATT